MLPLISLETRQLTVFGNLSEGVEMFGDELERLLIALFEDDDESDSEDVVILRDCTWPLEMLCNCCTYSYAAYDA